jgi:hypothetical protein
LPAELTAALQSAGGSPVPSADAGPPGDAAASPDPAGLDRAHLGPNPL